MPPRPHRNATPPNLIIVRKKSPLIVKKKKILLKPNPNIYSWLHNFVTYNIVY